MFQDHMINLLIFLNMRTGFTTVANRNTGIMNTKTKPPDGSLNDKTTIINRETNATTLYVR